MACNALPMAKLLDAPVKHFVRARRSVKRLDPPTIFTERKQFCHRFVARASSPNSCRGLSGFQSGPQRGSNGHPVILPASDTPRRTIPPSRMPLSSIRRDRRLYHVNCNSHWAAPIKWFPGNCAQRPRLLPKLTPDIIVKSIDLSICHKHAILISATEICDAFTDGRQFWHSRVAGCGGSLHNARRDIFP